ncbi:hypothetical protein HFD88_007762 [Aspergillus terreus]|nr:hypothetical protein HFD88_007762 [Aspergillus terreus]
MWSIHSFTLLSLVYTCFYTLVHARPWVVTELKQKVTLTEDYYYGSTVVTSIQQITATATALPEALSTITVVSTDRYDYEDVTVVQKLYPTGVGAPVDYRHRYLDTYYLSDSDSALSTVFKVNLTYSAPSACSTQWTTTVAAEVTPPAIAQSLLPRSAVATSVSVDSSEPFQPTTYSYKVIYVAPSQVPSSTLSSLRLYSRPTDLYSGSGCSYYDDPDSSSTYNYYSHYSSDYWDNYNWFLDDYYMGITPLGLTLALSIGWIGLWLLLGFVEAWVRFRRLMTGWQTRRGLPVCWAITILPVTLLLLFAFKKGFRARSQADAEVLQRRWNAMSLGTKLKLFFVWGFRYKYPPMLGPAPARVKTSKQPGKNPGPRLLEPTPPRTPEESRQGSAVPEQMVEVEGAQGAHGVPHEEQVGRAQ